MLLVARCALLLSVLSPVLPMCPESPWKEWNGYCYRLSFRKSVWHGARAECKVPFRGAELASVTSAAEQEFIQGTIVGDRDVWLGMRLHNGERWWVDGGQVSFTNFAGAGNADSYTSYAADNADSYTSYGAENADSYTSYGAENADSYTSFAADNADSYTGYGAENADSYTSYAADNADSYTSYGAENADSYTSYAAGNADSSTDFAAGNADSSTNFAAGNADSFTGFAAGSDAYTGANDVVKMVGQTGIWKPVSSYETLTTLHGVCKMPSCSCPSGWRLWRRLCNRAVVKRLSWVEAHRECQRMAPTADLVTIRNDSDNNFVASLVNGSSTTWIGLNDRKQEGLFRWSFDNLTFSNWRQGAPCDGQHQKDCVVMKKDKLWEDTSCHTNVTSEAFVCQHLMCGRSRDIRPEQTRVGRVRVWRPEDGVRCPPGWSRSGNKCFSRPTAPDTFGAVKDQCSAQHPQGTLANVTSLQDNDRAFLVADKMPVWISSSSGFANWKQYKRDKSHDSVCTTLQKSGQWLDLACNSELPGLCEVPACTPTCPDGWSLFQGHCYYVEDVEEAAGNAEKTCTTHGGHLTSIGSQEENDFIQTLVFSDAGQCEMLSEDKRYVWIGASWIDALSGWIWRDCSKWRISHWVGRDGNLPKPPAPPGTDIAAAMTTDGRWQSFAYCNATKFRSVCKLDPCRKHFGLVESAGC